MGANPTETTEMAEGESVQPSMALSDVEETLTEKAANQEADEAYLGVAETAEIVDVRTDDVDEDVAVEFEVSLPNAKRGRLAFSDYDFERGRVEEFLDNIDCTVDDMIDAMYHDIPVTFTNWKGWVVVYGDSKHLETTFAGESDWYTIDEDTAHPNPNRKYGTMLSSPFYIGVIASLLLWSIVPVIFGVIGAGALWYLNCMQVGFTMPNRKHIAVTDED